MLLSGAPKASARCLGPPLQREKAPQGSLQGLPPTSFSWLVDSCLVKGSGNAQSKPHY